MIDRQSTISYWEKKVSYVENLNFDWRCGDIAGTSRSSISRGNVQEVDREGGKIDEDDVRQRRLSHELI